LWLFIEEPDSHLATIRSPDWGAIAERAVHDCDVHNLQTWSAGRAMVGAGIFLGRSQT